MAVDTASGSRLRAFGALGVGAWMAIVLGGLEACTLVFQSPDPLQCRVDKDCAALSSGAEGGRCIDGLCREVPSADAGPPKVSDGSFVDGNVPADSSPPPPEKDGSAPADAMPEATTDANNDSGNPALLTYASCKSSQGALPASGLRKVFSVLRGGNASDVYCDNATAGGGWMLAAKFTASQNMSLFPAGKYNNYFFSDIWIKGSSDGPPSSPSSTYTDFRVESLDWSSYLKTGKNYRLRQTVKVFKNSSETTAFDVSYAFTYNGFTVQNDTTGLANRAWVLSARQLHQSNVTFAWDTPATDVVRFWLPTLPGYSGNVVTGCSGYALGPELCYPTDARRRYGNAGIIGSDADLADPAIGWMPHMRSDFDDTNNPPAIAAAAQRGNYFTSQGGAGTDKVLGLYWLRDEF